jgi:hypothetical protein
MEEDLEEDPDQEEEEDGGVLIGDIDIDLLPVVEDMVGIVPGIGLVDYVKMDVLILGMINGVANIPGADLMTVGPLLIVMGADIRLLEKKAREKNKYYVMNIM